MRNNFIEDEEFIRGKVPMTKQEIRILTLAKANIGAEDIIVDIGAGTGSISIQAAKIAEQGKVFAVDKNFSAIELIQQNAEKFSVQNIEIIHADALDALKKIPRIDTAIIGGSGGTIQEILSAVDSKLKIGGRIVLNFITVQSLAKCLVWLKTQKSYEYDAIQVQVNRLKVVGAYDMAQALNPVHIVAAEKISQKQAKNVISLMRNA